MTVNELFKNGTIRFLFDRGFLKSAGFMACIRYECYQSFLKDGWNKTNAVRLTAEEFHVEENTIWNALKLMEQDLPQKMQ